MITLRLLVISAFAIAIVGCKGTREGIKQDYKTTRDDVAELVTKSPEEIQEEKTELGSKIEAQRYKIESEVKSIKEMEFDEEHKNTVTYTLDELDDMLADLENAGNRIAESSTEGWNEVKNEVEEELAKIEKDTDKLSKDLFADLD